MSDAHSADIAARWQRAKRLLRDPCEVHRLLTLRCDHCGHRFRWINDPRHSFGNRDGKVLHGPCIGYLTWRNKAEERLAILALTLDVVGVTDRDIKAAAELRADSEDERIESSHRAFRVFYDMEKAYRIPPVSTEEADRG